MNILEMRELLNQGKTIYDLPLRVTFYSIESNKMMFVFPRTKNNRKADPVRVRVTDVNLVVAV